MITSKTSVLIYATSRLHQEAWSALLGTQPYLQVVGSASSIDDLPPLPHEDQLTAILIDVAHPDTDIEALRSSLPDSTGLLVLVDSYGNLEHILSLLRAGATGLLEHSETVGNLARALIAVSRNEIVLPPTIAAQVLSALARGAPVESPVLDALTEREADVLSLLARGLTNKDIAQTLILSVRTVEAHLRSVYSKLGVGSRTEAALWAVRNGYGTEPAHLGSFT
jgi:DNA-binding NarL/FixJ family response regulator